MHQAVMYEVGNVNPIMDGELDGFINAYLMMEKEAAP
jgi:peptide chain release factor 2